VKNLRSLALSAVVFAALFVSSASAKPGWLTNFKEAQDEAKANKKLLLLDFTGSDWCGWCIKLEREVFAKPEFKEYASKNLILLEVDFPRGKDLPGTQKVQNNHLAQQYGVQGFPTIIVLDGEGKRLAELGYEAGVPADARDMKATPEAFIATLEKLRKG